MDGSRGLPPGERPRVEGRAAGRRGFTITELLVTIIILFLLITMLVVAVNRARAIAATNAERVTVSTMKTGVERFEGEFGFLPPLVKDNPDPTKYTDWNAPLSGEAPLDMNDQPVVYSTGNAQDLEFLRGGGGGIGGGGGSSDRDYRFSEYSLPYYLMGALGVVTGNDSDPAVDGVDGPGFRTPRRDGGFNPTGRSFEPFFTPARGSQGLIAVDTMEGRYELRDANGVAYRYYRWEHGDPEDGSMDEFPEDYNVPEIVGDATDDIALRGARWAIVAAGPNGVFGDRTEGGAGDPKEYWETQLGRASNEPTLLRRARSDNVVEVGG